jgi:hypothetical protein
VNADEARPGDPHKPPAPKLTGFGRRGAGLAGLVTGGQLPTVEPQPEQAPPAVPTPAEDSVESRPTPATSEARAREATPAAATKNGGANSEPPAMAIDQNDPAALVVSPTVLSVPEPLMRRFERARRLAESNTAVVLDALRAHARELPQLVSQVRRPASAAGERDLFPWRSSTRPARGAATKVRRVQLPIRPLAGELQVIDSLVDWVQQEIGAAPRSLGGRATRSEVVAAALNAYLPQERRRSEGDAAPSGG